MANELLQNMLQLASQMDEDNNKLTSRIEALEALAAHENEQESRLAALEAKLEYNSALVARVSALEARIALLEKQPHEVKAAPVQAAAPDMSGFLAKLAALEEQLSDLEEAHAELESRMDEVESNPAFGYISEEDDFEDQAAEWSKSDAPAPTAPVAPAAPALNEDETILTDEETGLPELEVEWEEAAPATADEVAPATAVQPAVEVAPATAVQPAEEVAPATAAQPAHVETIADRDDHVETIADKAAETAAPAASTIVPKVDSIKKAISIGDRFLFQRELFKNDAPLYAKTIAELDALSSLDEATAYINKRFSWDPESQTYELFMNVLKRRW